MLTAPPDSTYTPLYSNHKYYLTSLNLSLRISLELSGFPMTLVHIHLLCQTSHVAMLISFEVGNAICLSPHLMLRLGPVLSSVGCNLERCLIDLDCRLRLGFLHCRLYPATSLPATRPSALGNNIISWDRVISREVPPREPLSQGSLSDTLRNDEGLTQNEM